jgi:hypothetical protein
MGVLLDERRDEDGSKRQNLQFFKPNRSPAQSIRAEAAIKLIAKINHHGRRIAPMGRSAWVTTAQG